MAIKVAIYEDNDDLRESLIYLLASKEHIEIVGAYEDAIQALENTKHDVPDVILMDIGMPKISGIVATEMIKANYPDVEIVILTMFEDEDNIFEALQAGASGYILKKTDPEKIIAYLSDVVEGGVPMSPVIARKALKFFAQLERTTKFNKYNLTDREKEIVERLVAGDSYKLICAHLDISMGTVRSHITNVYRKLHVNSKSEVVFKAIKERIVDTI